MKTFQDWPFWLLGSTFLSDPYQTASARPGPPACTHGNTLTASPVPVEPSLTWTGFVHFRQPLEAEAALTKTCRFAGLPSFGLSAQQTIRFRPVSSEATVKSVSGDPGRLSATWISALSFPLPPGVVGLSRNVRLPLESGVPMFRSRSDVPSGLPAPAVWKTLPVCWSMAGYPSAPNGVYEAPLPGEAPASAFV